MDTSAAHGIRIDAPSREGARAGRIAGTHRPGGGEMRDGGASAPADGAQGPVGGTGPQGTTGAQGMMGGVGAAGASGTTTVVGRTRSATSSKTVDLQSFVVVRNHRAGDTTFVFGQGDGLDVIHGFKLGGASHDAIALPSSDVADPPHLFLNADDVNGSAFITDTVTGDAARLVGVTTAELSSSCVSSSTSLTAHTSAGIKTGTSATAHRRPASRP